MASYPSAVTGMNDFFRLKEAGAFPADVAGMSAELEHDMFYAGKAAIWTSGSSTGKKGWIGLRPGSSASR